MTCIGNLFPWRSYPVFLSGILIRLSCLIFFIGNPSWLVWDGTPLPAGGDAEKERRPKALHLSEIVKTMKFGFLHLKQALLIAYVLAKLFLPAGAAQPPGEGEKIVS